MLDKRSRLVTIAGRDPSHEDSFWRMANPGVSMKWRRPDPAVLPRPAATERLRSDVFAWRVGSSLGPCQAGGSHGDDDLPPGVSFFEVADSLSNLAQRIGPVDDRRDLPGLEKLAQDGQIALALVRQEGNHPLAHRW